jgi:hypothetical protein
MTCASYNTASSTHFELPTGRIAGVGCVAIPAWAIPLLMTLRGCYSIELIQGWVEPEMFQGCDVRVCV